MFWDRKVIWDCCDGTTMEVFKDSNNAFPLYFRDWEKARNAAVSVSDEFSASLTESEKSSVSTALHGLDGINRSMQAKFAAAYELFSISPCGYLDRLYQDVQRITESETELRRLVFILTAAGKMEQNSHGHEALARMMDAITACMSATNSEVKQAGGLVEEWVSSPNKGSKK